MQEAMFYEKSEDSVVKCVLCPHSCLLKDGMAGTCGARKNIQGKLYSLVYGKIAGAAIDPIEKKPLFHFHPGTGIYSFSTVGCNFRCAFCQNWDLSQIPKGKSGRITGDDATPDMIVDAALRLGQKSIAMTYNEPGIQYEFAYETCRLAKKKGLSTVFVSNGYLNKEPIDKISKYLDAINIDIKSFSDGFYKKICGARLAPVLEAVKEYKKNKVWVEITTLIIPGENDSDSELEGIARFIASVDKDIPWHISAFHPDYKMMDRPATPAKTLENAYNLGKDEGLRFIYAGNIHIGGMEDTYCPACKKRLIERYGYKIVCNHIKRGKCCFCSIPIPGIYPD